MTVPKRLTWVLRWLVSAGLLAWILSRPELGRLGGEFRRMDWGWLLGGFACAGLSIALTAWRWDACLRGLGMEVAPGRLLGITLAGFAAGCVSFGGLGTDLAKVALLGRILPGRHGGIVSSLMMDHASALPCMVVMVSAALVWHGQAFRLNAAAIWIILGITLAAVAAVGVIAWKFKHIHAAAMQFFSSRALWRGLLTATWRSVLMWLAYCGIFYSAGRSLGVEVAPAGFAGVIAIADSVASLPITIAGLGVREEAFRVLLGQWYAVPASTAVAISLAGFSLLLAWAAIGAVHFASGPFKPQP